MKTRPYITERLLMGRNESNQTKQSNRVASPVDAVGSYRRSNEGGTLNMLKTNIIALRSNKSTVGSP